jgi:hypothetical protein
MQGHMGLWSGSIQRLRHVRFGWSDLKKSDMGKCPPNKSLEPSPIAQKLDPITLHKRQEATISSDKRRHFLMNQSDNWRQVRCRFLSLCFGLLLPSTISLGDGV